MVETIASVNGSEMLIDAKSVQHGAAEMDRLVCEHGKLAVCKSVQRFQNARIEDGTVQHVSTIVGQKHLQSGLNVRLGGLQPQRPPDQHQRAIADKAGNLFLRQNWQAKLIPDVIHRSGEVFFGINESTIEIKDENRTHGVIIAP